MQSAKKCDFHMQKKSLTEKRLFAAVITKTSNATECCKLQKWILILKVRGTEMRKLDPKEAREIFEQELGKRISDSNWYRLKSIFCDDFPPTKQNVIWLGGVKKQLPKCDLRLVPIVNSVRQTNELILNQNSQISGKELLELFNHHQIKIHANTLTKWFKPLHGFRKTRIYELKELYPIILAAHTYQLRKQVEKTSELFIPAS